MTPNLQGPLAGLRAIDFSIQAAGPWAGALLGMLGMDVIKIERPNGDGTRWALPRQRGMGTNYISLNVNKRNVVLDLKTDEGRAAALELAATSDVLVENYRVGVMERLGLGYDVVHRRNPRLVYCAISGFGSKGPLAKAGCGDAVMQAFSGFAKGNGAPGDEVEAFRFTGLLDLATASVAANAILAAVLEREATGLGQKVELSMLEAALEMQCTRVADILYGDVDPVPRGSASYGLVPDRAYATADREIFVTVHSDAEWQGFCKAIERPALATDSSFSSNGARVQHRSALDAIVEPVIAARPAIWWLRAFARYDVPAGIAHDFETYRHHEQIVSNKMIAPLSTRDWGEVSVAGPPWHFSETPCVVREPARPNEHTDEILSSLNLGSRIRAASVT